jgi:hypothetical protein
MQPGCEAIQASDREGTPVDRGSNLAQAAANDGLAPAAPRDGKQPDLDLDRLVWDPEYREAMRHWLGRAG